MKTSGIWETVRTIVYAVAIALVVRTFLFEPFNIPSGSMKPNLLIGDYLFVSKYAYGYSRNSFPLRLPLIPGRILASTPERGDIAVFKKPTNPSEDYIKRIVGLPGDKVQMRAGFLFINGEPVDKVRIEPFVDDGPRAGQIDQFTETLPDGRSYQVLDRNYFEAGAEGSDAATALGRFPDTTDVYEVPPGHVFAMGDNRDNSVDSRYPQVGFVPLENLVGRAEIIFYSTDGSASWLEPWKWPFAIRYDRLLKSIQ